MATPSTAADPGCRRVAVEGPELPRSAIRWSVTVGGAEAKILDAWCAAVGEGLLSPLPALATPHPLDSLVVVSWNVHGGGGDLERLVADLRGGRIGGGPARHFVLLLQEAYRAGELPDPPPGAVVPAGVREAPPGGERRDVAEHAKRLGLALFYLPSMRNGAALEGGEEEDRGNAILSTLPLMDPRVIELPYESQRRVAVAATVRAPGADTAGHPLRVVSIHLDTRSTGRRLWAAFGAGRLRQARALEAALPGNQATVMGGDLNTWSIASLEGAVGYLLSRFPQTPRVPLRATLVTGWGYRRRLDHLFFRLPERWTVGYRRLDERYGSDHHPLVGTVHFRDAAPPDPR